MLTLVLLVSLSCSSGPGTSVQEKNKETVRIIWEEIVNGGEMERAEQLLSPDYIYHAPGGEDIHGIERGFIAPLEKLRRAFPDLVCRVDDMIAEGDLVVHRWSAGGTHLDEYAGVPPTGGSISMTGIVVSRLEAGVVVEDWSNTDELGVLQQLGRFPAREAGDYTWGKTSLADDEPCLTQESRNLYLSELDLVWKEKRIDAVDELFSPDFVNHDPAWPEITDRNGYRGWVEEWHEQAPGMQISLEQLVVEDDRAASRWTARWTDAAGLGGLPPSGRELTVSGTDIIRCAGGVIVERWWAKDILGVLKQAGLFPGAAIPEEGEPEEEESPPL